MRSHGLNALALDRQHQPRAVATKWLDTISVPKRLSHQRHILLESRRRGFHRSPHNVLEDKRIMPYFLTQWYYETTCGASLRDYLRGVRHGASRYVTIAPRSKSNSS